MNNSVSNINKERYATEVQEFGHHGEILQGVFEGDDGKLHRGLITLKCKLFSSTAIYVRTKDPNIVSVMPEKKKKALVAAASTLKYIGKNIKYGGYLILQSNMPEEMGFGSSTCDVTASIKAVASSFNISLSPYEIANIAVNSERASDAIMFVKNVEYLNGLITKDEMIDKIKMETRRYAKRQLTWFRKYKNLIWINGLDDVQNNIKIILEEYSEKNN